jgi:hypothetical protein
MPSPFLYLIILILSSLQCCGFGMFIPDPTFFHPGSRIRLFSIPDPRFRIPDPNGLHPGSRIRIKEFKYFNPKKWFLSSRKYDPGCSSRIRMLTSTHPGSRIQGSKRHRIPDPDLQHCFSL